MPVLMSGNLGAPALAATTGAGVPVVFVGGTLNSLGAIRSLSRGAMPIFVIDTSRRCPSAWSRYCEFVRAPSLEGGDLIDCLVALAARLPPRPVLAVSNDIAVEAISAHRDRVEPLYRISLPSMEMVRALGDKALFQTLARREGFSVPRGAALTDVNDLSELQQLSPPLILKPADKGFVLNGVVERAVRVESLAEAEAAATRMLGRVPSVIAQEWIDGPDTEIFFTLFVCDQRGGLLGLFCGRKVVCSPPAIGNTAVCVAAPEAEDELRAQTLSFIARVGYRGIGGLEFKRDSRTHRFLIVEPTVCRTDWQSEIATLCGVNLPWLAYCSEVGLPVTAEQPGSPPVAWQASLEVGAPAGALPPGTRVVDGYFRWSDPVPALYYYGFERVLVRIWHRARRLMGWRKTG